jgi:uncharacterized protein (TIGR02996 family)
MSDRDALLAAIQAAPDDDAPRLIFADWLDEHGETGRAEFIRVQIEMAPFERRETDVDRFQRAVIRRDPSRPLPVGFPEEYRRYAALVAREQELLQAYRFEWYGPMCRIDDDYESQLHIVFRRGFIDEVRVTTSAFLASGQTIRSSCPVLRRLVLFGARGELPELTAMTALGGVPELELADWITPFDARFLATFLAENPVRSLTCWIGSRNDAEMIRTLATRPWADDAERPFDRAAHLAPGPYLGRLREFVLVQLHGGLFARDLAGDLNRRADALAQEFVRIVGRAIVRVVRPFERRFPLHGQVGSGVFAGSSPTYGAGLICANLDPTFIKFDADGYREGELRLERMKSNRSKHRHWPTLDDREMFKALQRDIAFEPGPVFVREFHSEDADLGVFLWGTCEDVIGDPDSHTDDDDHEEVCAAIHGFMKGGNFVIQTGSDSLAGPDGTIYTS